MKRLLGLLMLFVMLMVSGQPAIGDETRKDDKKGSWQIKGSSATFLKWKGTYGEEAGTAKNDGESYRQELSGYIFRELGEGDRIGLDFRVRATSDEQVDDKDVRLLYLRGYRNTKNYRAAIGDVAGSYNPYVFSSALRGAKLDLSPYKRKGLRTSIIGGIQKASWHEIATNVDDEQPDRWVGGVNAQYIFDAGRQVGFTLAMARDREDTGDNEDVQAPGASAFNAGLDGEWRFNRYLTLKSNMAIMEGTDNLRDDHDDEEGHAIKLRLLTKPLPRSLRSNFTYEYVSTDFAPLVGSGAADRERFENDTSYHFNRQLKFRVTLKHSRDNLDGSKEDTQYINDGVFYCDYRPDFLKRGDLGLRFQTKSIDGSGVDQMQYESEAYVNVRPKSGWRLGGAYIYSHLDDETDGAEDQDIHTLRGTLGWKKNLGKDSRFRSTLRMDYRLVEQGTSDQDKIGASIDLGYDMDAYWSFDLAARTNANDREESDDTSYGNYQARLSFHPWKDRTKTLRLIAEQRVYDSDSTTTDQTYTENNLELSYRFTF